MQSRDALAFDVEMAVQIALQFLVFRIADQCRAAVLQIGQHGIELRARQLRIGTRGAHFGIGLVRFETAAERACQQMLGQHIETAAQRMPRLQMVGGQRAPRGRDLGQLQQVRGHAQNFRRQARRMAAAAGALQQPRHALGAADLDHPVDAGKIHAEVEARRGDHAAQRALAQTFFHREAQLGIDRAVVHGQRFRRFGPHGGERLVPQLGLRSRVGEHQRRAYVEYGA